MASTEKASPVDAAYLDLDGWGAFRSFSDAMDARVAIARPVKLLLFGRLLSRCYSEQGPFPLSFLSLFGLKCGKVR